MKEALLKCMEKNKLSLFLLIILLLYVGALNNYLGVFGDDAQFVVLGKSITQGKYALISAPGEPAHTKIPPLFPLLLSPVILFFGYNFFLLKLVSCLALIGALTILYKLLSTINKQLSFMAFLISALCPLVFLFSHEVMSESLYMLLSFLALYFLHKDEQINRGISPSFLFGVIFSAAAFLTRMIGISLLAAVIFLGIIKYLSGKDKKLVLKKTAVFCILFISLGAFWVIRIARVDETPVYLQEFLKGDTEKNELIKGQSLFPDTESNLFFRFLDNLYYYSGPIIALDLKKAVSTQGDSFLRFIFPFGILLWLILFSSILIQLYKRQSIIDAYVLIYLGIIFLWYWRSLRFLSPVIPFLILYLLHSIQGILRALSKRHLKIIFRAVVAVLLLINLTGFAYEFRRQHREKFYNEEWDSYYKASLWLKNAEEGIVLARKWANTFVWSGKKCVMVPQTSDRDYVEGFIEENKIGYILLDGFERYKTKDFLGFIAHSDQFRLVHQEKHAEIYQRVNR